VSDCTVWTEFEGDQFRGDQSRGDQSQGNKRVFKPGDKIVGTVYVKFDRAPSDSSVYYERKLSLRRYWRTSGRPRPRTGGSDTILLFDGSWKSARTYQYPFIFHVPPGPYTYHGHLVDVDWFLCAEVHREDAPIDSNPTVSAEETFGVEPSGKEREFIVGDTSSDSNGDHQGIGGPERVLWMLGTLILLSVGLLLVYPNVAALPGASWLTLLAGMGCLGLAGFSGHALMRRQRQNDDTAMVEPTPDDYQIEPGDRVAFVVELQPNFKTSPKGVTAVLKGYERVCLDGGELDSGEASHTDIHRFHEEAISIEPTDGAAFEQGQKNSYQVRFRMPTDAPYSFYCPNASVNWAVEVHVDVGSWPDWHRDFPVIVRPCVGDGSLRVDASVVDRGELG
jgi:hypothetical protein